MQIARIVGSVVSTQKDEGLLDRKLLVCQVHDHQGAPKDQYVVAVDAVGAGLLTLVSVDVQSSSGGVGTVSAVTVGNVAQVGIELAGDVLVVHGGVLVMRAAARDGGLNRSVR